MRELGAISVSLLLVTGLLLYLCYAAGHRRWYLYLSLAWALNAAYIGILAWHLSGYAEAHQLSPIRKSFLEYLYGCPATIAFGRAWYSMRFERTQIAIPEWVLFMPILAILAFALYGVSEVHTTDDSIQFFAATAPGVFASAAALAGLAFEIRALKVAELLDSLTPMPRREGRPTAIEKRRLLHELEQAGALTVNPQYKAEYTCLKAQALSRISYHAIAGSMILYSMLQFAYFAQPFLNPGPIVLSMYAVGLTCKVGFALGVSLLLLANYVSAAEQLSALHSAEEIGYLAASIEHDMRTPLGSAATQLLILIAKHGQQQEALRKGLRAVENQLARIEDTLNIIPFLRDRSLATIRKGRLDLRELAGSARTSILEEVAARPDCAALVRRSDFIVVESKQKQYWVRGSRTHLIRALENVLRNSVEAIAEFTPHDGAIKITLGEDVDRRMITLNICDNGGGVSAEARQQMAIPFFSTKKTQGNANRGIGVYITALIVERHEGTLVYESSPEERTTQVSIALPFAKDETVHGEVATR